MDSPTKLHCSWHVCVFFFFFLRFLVLFIFTGGLQQTKCFSLPRVEMVSLIAKWVAHPRAKSGDSEHERILRLGHHELMCLTLASRQGSRGHLSRSLNLGS